VRLRVEKNYEMKREIEDIHVPKGLPSRSWLSIASALTDGRECGRH
jgi:hypothetical protein